MAFWSRFCRLKTQVQVFIKAYLASGHFFCQRFSFFTGCLVKFLHEVLPCWAPKGSLGLQIAGNSFLTLFLTAEAQLAHFLSAVAAAAAIFPRAVEFHGGFFEIEFFNFIQALVFTTVYWLQKSSWKNQGVIQEFILGVSSHMNITL